MEEDKNINEALDFYIKSLEEEEESGRLLENAPIIEKNDKINKVEEVKSNDVNGMEKLAKILKKSVELICLGEEVKISTNLKEQKIAVHGDDLGMAIGKDGKNMAALEYIINLIGRRQKLVEKKINIDIKDYRKNKISKIKRVAVKMAKKAIKEGRKIALRPMCAYDRKIIHNVLAKIKDVDTKSRYEEPNRRIVIYPLKEAK